MARTLAIDIETYSNAPLDSVGVYRYADDPSFEVLLLAYAFDDDEVQIVDLASGEELPQQVIDAIFDPHTIKTAFNAQFERVCLSKHFGLTLNPESWHCTMVHAWSLGLSGGLDAVAKILGLPQDKQKMWVGKNLIRLFSVPRKLSTMDGQLSLFHGRLLGDCYRYGPQDKPQEWELFREYCKQDVVVEREVRKRLATYPMSQTEWALYQLDQRINDYGVRLDMDFVAQAIKIDSIYTEELATKFTRLTGIENPNALEEFKRWLSKRLGFLVDSVTKKTLPKLLEEAAYIPDAKEALRLRQELSKTSVTKYAKMAEIICSDNRARGLLQFYGASRTGRWAGRLVQVQNLPRNSIADLDLARQVVKDGDLETLEMLYPSVPDILSQLIRTAFIPSDGRRFIVSDFSAIEARVIAWYAKEQWRLDVFNSHGKIYEASASQMFGVPVERITKDHPLRQKGKIAELALGYQGAVGALIQMGALDMGLKEHELPELVQQWRQANPNIVKFWADVEAAARETIKGKTSTISPQGVKFIYEPGVLFIELASGRRLAYPNPRVEPDGKITFDGVDNGKWGRVDTYGGKLVENIVQATARDCLAEGLLRLHAAGYKIAFHVHDEVVLDVPIGQGSVEEVNAILSQPLPWAPDLPLRADGFECMYYQKD